MKRAVWAALAACVALAQAPTAEHGIAPLAANDLRFDVSYLASDALEGRGTPSRGLEIAAEYIATEFRRAGLEPAGADGYFQTAVYEHGVADPESGRAASGKPVTLRNVIGILRGSDPSLRDTYVLLTAHYDHLGVRGDRIFNGANDDASGVASVIEIARALAAAPARPKRSIVFLALFGEEVGLLGSRYYVAHAVVPLVRTVADLNLECLGRTDVDGGPLRNILNVTGYDYTSITPVLRKAGEDSGIKVEKDRHNSDTFFALSDNISFADAGVPAHTISVGYLYPDYHSVGDKWTKLDYGNLAHVDNAIALALYRIADSGTAPQWNAENRKTRDYIRARENSVIAQPR